MARVGPLNGVDTGLLFDLLDYGKDIGDFSLHLFPVSCSCRNASRDTLYIIGLWQNKMW